MALDEYTGQLPLETVGQKLRLAREAAGQSRADIARITKISERLLVVLEEGNYAALPARTYATGFARSYARAVGLDAEAIVRQVRLELDGAPPRVERPVAVTYEYGDPARVPSRRIVWFALGGLALLLVVLAAWHFLSPAAGELPSVLPAETPAPAAKPSIAPKPAPAPSGPVVFTAEAEGVWVRFADASGKVLFEKTMTQGESYTLPADAVGPVLRTGRPDALAITIGGQPVPRLADKQTMSRTLDIIKS